ncbi:MAG TPA: hypothetical protein VNQ77_02830 [Frankiaceae bacterium]|nr:hypothetical protein [Frankiaceae bacterium]
MPLSAPAALYVAAEAVAPKAGKLSYGIDVPGKDGTSVDLKTLSGVLAAAALWSLRENGAAEIAFEEKKGMLGTKTRVAVRPRGGVQPPSAIEAELLQAAADKPYAKDAVHRWLRTEHDNPWGVVASVVEGELVQAGVLQPVAPQGKLGKLGALAGKRQKMAGNTEALVAIHPEVSAVVQRWFAFNQAEPQLAQALVKECRDAIDSRLDTD